MRNIRDYKEAKKGVHEDEREPESPRVCVREPRPFSSCPYSPECVEEKFCELHMLKI